MQQIATQTNSQNITQNNTKISQTTHTQKTKKNNGIKQSNKTKIIIMHCKITIQTINKTINKFKKIKKKKQKWQTNFFLIIFFF